MPRIEFSRLPPEIRRHLVRRLHQRLSSARELEALISWVSTQPEAPVGDWYKDFGSFKLCGTGAYPKTVLTGAMRPWGQKI